MMGPRELKTFIDKATAMIRGQLRDMVRLGKVGRLKDDDDVQTMQAVDMQGRTEDDVVNLNHYGLSTNPPAESKGLLVSINGSTEQSAMIFASPSGRPTVEDGEVIVWSIHEQTMKFAKTGDVSISCAQDGVKIDMKVSGEASMVAKTGAKIEMNTTGQITVTTPAAALIKLGSAAAVLGVARFTDSVGPSPELIAYQTFCEGLFNSLLPGSFTAFNNFAAVVLRSGIITGASAKTLSA